MLKQTTNTWKIMSLKNRQNTYCTLISIICMVGQWLVVLLMMDLSGSIISWWITWITKSILAPETLAIPYNILSDYCKQVADDYRIKVGDVMKLVPNLRNKTNYVAH